MVLQENFKGMNLTSAILIELHPTHTNLDKLDLPHACICTKPTPFNIKIKNSNSDLLIRKIHALTRP